MKRGTRITRSISKATTALGSSPAVFLAVLLVLSWIIGGFVFVSFSSQLYQLLINTTTTIITFIMVFVIQNTQNRDGVAIQAKLDAQSQIIQAMAQHMGLDVDTILETLVGIEDEPEKIIEEHRQDVRDKSHI